MITGIRGLCNGLGPALYGFIFFLFDVELNTMDPIQGDYSIDPLPLHSPTEVPKQQPQNTHMSFTLGSFRTNTFLPILLSLRGH